MPTKHFTLTFILDEVKGQVLLGYKKRGFGANYWNGFGGKVEPVEEIVQAAKREVKEECSLNIELDDSDLVGVLDYNFTTKPDEILVSHIYLTKKYQGSIHESEEMRPQWWPIADIPYHLMWADSSDWYALMFQGKRLKGGVTFNEENQIVSKNIVIDENL